MWYYRLNKDDGLEWAYYHIWSLLYTIDTCLSMDFFIYTRYFSTVFS